MKLHVCQQWGPVALVAIEAEPSDPTADRAALAFLFDTVQPSDLWSVDAILKNWRCRMNLRYVRATEQARQATLAHGDKLVAWVEQTRSLARDLRPVYGDRLAELLTHVAQEVDEAIVWPSLRIQNPPIDPKGRADLFLTIDLWAHDRVRESLERLYIGKPEGVPGKDAGRTMLLTPALDALRDAGLSAMQSDEGWKMRVHRLRVQSGQEDNLVADVLDACRRGPYDQHGRETDRVTNPA
jgi:hypothetical protein